MIRLADKSDLDAILDLREAVAAEGRWISDARAEDRPAARALYEQRVVDADRLLLVADRGDSDNERRVVGALSLDVRRGRAELGMFLAESHRSKGIGTSLLTAAVDWAKDNDVHKIYLEVWPHNAPARRLYEKLGFEVEGVLRRHYRKGEGELWDSVIMGLILDHTSPGSRYDTER